MECVAANVHWQDNCGEEPRKRRRLKCLKLQGIRLGSICRRVYGNAI